MGTTAVSVLEQRLAESIGDWIEVAVTTAINADNLIVSTNLNQYDHGRDDYFIDWWAYITDENNAGVNRQVSDYATSGGQLTVRGAALTDDGADLATIRLHRYNRDKYITAFNDTVREISDDLFQKLDATDLVTSNSLPNSHFTDWTVSTYPDKYSLENVTATAETQSDYVYQRGTGSAKVTASAANGYLYITSRTYPRLLDLMNQSVTFRAWAYPEVADDASLVIYTEDKDSDTQTLESTTSNVAGRYTLLELEDQQLNDNLTMIEFRFKVATNAKYVYFDNARVIGYTRYEHLLPIDFRDGHISQVLVQDTTSTDYGCDDLAPRSWERVYGYEVMDDGTDKHLRLPLEYSWERKIRLIGYKPLSTVSAYTDTIEIDGDKVNLFIAYAKYKLYQAIEGPVASEDIGRYQSQSARAYGEYLRLRPKLKMSHPRQMLHIGGVY